MHCRREVLLLFTTQGESAGLLISPIDFLKAIQLFRQLSVKRVVNRYKLAEKLVKKSKNVKHVSNQTK